ncbi:CAAX amino terminal protease self- immunity [compost metagenome]
MNGFKSTSASTLLYFIGFTLLVGFVEETIYRGLILRTLLAKGVTTAVVTSSILFGVTHILNALSGQSLFDTIVQIVYALLVGLVLALLIIMNNNILPLITFHFILALQAIWLIVSLRKVPIQSALAS